MAEYSTNQLAHRMEGIQPSFIREILQLTQNQDIISFAGGLPNPDLFPVDEIAEAAATVFKTAGKSALQYTTTPGFLPLREWIVNRYYADIPGVTADNIIVTTGSQQAIDLLGKLFIDPGDPIIIEDPSYLGALQSLEVYEPKFIAVPLQETGIDLKKLNQQVSVHHPKCIYAVPTFQNPTGITYDLATRQKLAVMLKASKTLFIEDDPYREIHFNAEILPTIKSLAPDQTFHLGSFSKSVAPGFRLGWVCAPSLYVSKLIILKEGADLHTDHVSQRIVYEYISTKNLESHLEKVRQIYQDHKNQMVKAIQKFLPSSATFIDPLGGMFIWITLPTTISTSKLFKECILQKVAFVPGIYFYSLQNHDNCLRLNFSNANSDKIIDGIRTLGKILHQQ